MRALEFLQKLRLVSAALDVVANVICLREVEHDEIVACTVGRGLRGRGLGFLVLGLAVNDAGDALLRVLADALPHAHHVAAGGVHEQAALLLQLAPRGDLGAEGRDDDHVLALKHGEFHIGRLVREHPDAEVANLVVDLRVVDDFAQQVDGLLGRERAAGRVGEVNRAFNAIAKAELLRELDGQAGGGELVAACADALDQRAPIVRLHLGLHRRHDVGAAEVDLLRRSGGRNR